ncbi:MAG: ice-binding family protein [Bryobacteraceae bacterium]
MRHRLIWWVMAVAAVVPAFGGTIVSVNLNSASSFALLGSTITETGDSTIFGNVGATTTITQNGAWTVHGTIYPAGNSTAMTAYSDFESAYNTTIGLGNTQPLLSSLPLTQTFTGNNVYTFTSDISTTTGTVLTFDAQNNPNEVFVIQVDGAFTVNGALQFDLINGAQANNIFWIVKDAATISVDGSTPQTFDGSILAGTSFTMSAIAGGSGDLAGTINGCVFSETANTLAGQTNVNGCVGGGVPGGAPGGAGSTPEPGSSELVSLGCLLGIVAWRKFPVSL